MHTKYSVLAVIEHQAIERCLFHGGLLVQVGWARRSGAAD
jgi:hypothetical protein